MERRRAFATLAAQAARAAERRAAPRRQQQPLPLPPQQQLQRKQPTSAARAGAAGGTADTAGGAGKGGGKGGGGGGEQGSQRSRAARAALAAVSASALAVLPSPSLDEPGRRHGSRAGDKSSVVRRATREAQELIGQRVTLHELQSRYALGDGSGPEDDTLQWDNRATLQRYTVGSGAYGHVVRAVDRDDARAVAVKIINDQSLSWSVLRDEVEALRLSRMHPNVNELIEVLWCAETSSYYLVTAFCAGGELFDRLIAQGPLSESAAGLLVERITSALSHIHQCGFAHLDVKPENLLFRTKLGGAGGDEMDIRLIDFGMAKSLQTFFSEGFTPITSSIGTTPYLAPELLAKLREIVASQREEQLRLSKRRGRNEQQRTGSPLMHGQQQEEYPDVSTYATGGDDVETRPYFSRVRPRTVLMQLESDPRACDMFALGLIIYILLLGCHPFDRTGDATDEQIASRMFRGSNPDPGDAGRRPERRRFTFDVHAGLIQLSDGAQDLITGLLDPDPSTRYTSTDVLLHPWIREYGRAGNNRRVAKLQVASGKLAGTQAAGSSSRKSSSSNNNNNSSSSNNNNNSGNTTTTNNNIRTPRRHAPLSDDMFNLSSRAHRAVATALLVATLSRRGEATAGGGHAPSAVQGGEALQAAHGLEDSVKASGLSEQHASRGEDVLTSAFAVLGPIEWRALLSDGIMAGAEAASCSVAAARAAAAAAAEAPADAATSAAPELAQAGSWAGAALASTPVSRAEFADTVINCHCLNFDKGERLFSKGDPATGMYLLVRGAANVEYTGANDGEARVVATMRAGDMIGETAMLDGRNRRNASVTCTEPTDVVFLSREDFAIILGGATELTAGLEEHTRVRQNERARMLLAALATGTPSMMRKVSFKVGEALFEQGDESEFLFLITAGEVETFASFEGSNMGLPPLPDSAAAGHGFRAWFSKMWRWRSAEPAGPGGGSSGRDEPDHESAPGRGRDAPPLVAVHSRTRSRSRPSSTPAPALGAAPPPSATSQVRLRQYRAGDLLGAVTLSGFPCISSAVASTDVSALAVRRRDLETLVGAESSLRRNLVRLGRRDVEEKLARLRLAATSLAARQHMQLSSDAAGSGTPSLEDLLAVVRARLHEQETHVSRAPSRKAWTRSEPSA